MSTKNKKLPLTPYEVCDLRIRCTEVFAATATRNGLDSGRVFDLADQLWKRCEETIESTELLKTRD